MKVCDLHKDKFTVRGNVIEMNDKWTSDGVETFRRSYVDRLNRSGKVIYGLWEGCYCGCEAEIGDVYKHPSGVNIRVVRIVDDSENAEWCRSLGLTPASGRHYQIEAD